MLTILLIWYADSAESDFVNSTDQCMSICRIVSRSCRKNCFESPTNATPPLSGSSQKRIISEIEKRKQEKVKREASKKVRNVPKEKNSESNTLMTHKI